MIDKRKFYINGDWINPVFKNDFEVIVGKVLWIDANECSRNFEKLLLKYYYYWNFEIETFDIDAIWEFSNDWVLHWKNESG